MILFEDSNMLPAEIEAAHSATDRTLLSSKKKTANWLDKSNSDKPLFKTTSNKTGQILELILVNTKGKIITHQMFRYDNYGQLIERKNKGQLEGCIWDYHSNGQLSKSNCYGRKDEVLFDSSGVKLRKTMYNEQGRVTQVDSFFKFGELSCVETKQHYRNGNTSITRKEFNKSDELMKFLTYFENSTDVQFYIDYTYDLHGNPVTRKGYDAFWKYTTFITSSSFNKFNDIVGEKTISYDRDGKISKTEHRKFTYVYDNKGNWIQRTEIEGSSDLKTSVTKRKIYYY